MRTAREEKGEPTRERKWVIGELSVGRNCPSKRHREGLTAKLYTTSAWEERITNHAERSEEVRHAQM